MTRAGRLPAGSMRSSTAGCSIVLLKAKVRNSAVCSKSTPQLLRGGTGEIRNWIAIAGAYEGVKATVVDYIPSRHAVTGLGFAYWKN